MRLKTCHVYIFPIIIFLIYFSWATAKYIHVRNLLLSNVVTLGGDSAWDEKYIDVNRWLEKIKTTTTIDNKVDPNLCKNVAFFVDPNRRNDPLICREMSKQFCGIDGNILHLVTIPTDDDDNNHQPYYITNGMRLLPGETYCINKKPPIFLNYTCDEEWGFWKFSPVENRWICHSKVPGIYNAKLNAFDPCQREDSSGRFLIDGEVIPANEIKTRFTPETFYSPEFQKRCSCECNKKKGYIFNPDISRTSCLKDPCLVELPPFAAVPGYNSVTGYCDCGVYFTNMFNDPYSPCTACPYNFPHYDEKTHTLTIYIKCFNINDNNKNSFGLYPCQTEDDIIRGCTKAIINVKPINDNISSIIPFEERVFF